MACIDSLPLMLVLIESNPTMGFFVRIHHISNSNSFNMSNAKKLPLSDVELPFVMLGDEAHPLLSYFVRPYPRRQLTESRRQFNYRLSSGRRAVESAFGILAGKWRILNKPSETSPDMADKIVKYVCVLHKTVIDREGLDEVSLLELENYQSSFSPSLHTPARQVTRYKNIKFEGQKGKRCIQCLFM